MSKELKLGKTHIKDELSDGKKQKIKQFVKEYMDKVMAHRELKHKSRNSDPGPGPSDSVESTVTPQASGSTPPERHEKDGELDVYTTPTSRSMSRTPGVVDGANGT